VCIDTEFPGHIYPLPPETFFRDVRDRAYVHMWNNVKVTTPIQIGFALFDENGNRPEGTCVWQFNMKFTRATATQNLDSIAMLENHGIDFELLETRGIDPQRFGDLLNDSALSGNKNITWVNFQGAYDFAYLMKCVCHRFTEPVPIKYEDFGKQMMAYFPRVIDIKFVFSFQDKEIQGGLKKFAKSLGLGVEAGNLQLHQAGTDAYLTGLCFFRMQSLKWQSPTHGPSDFQQIGNLMERFINCFYGLSEPTLSRALEKLPGYLHSLRTQPPQEDILSTMPMRFTKPIRQDAPHHVQLNP
jgi:CCR4-NOT transcription complex subunit 7/8